MSEGVATLRHHLYMCIQILMQKDDVLQFGTLNAPAVCFYLRKNNNKTPKVEKEVGLLIILKYPVYSQQIYRT